ncbi:MAG: 3-hydroxybutyryl-CoA dehydrogenase [Candidatus Eisenbacteria bacterium]|nr:3-hydroxybutyryl-CoA dehydrogenase [Candidatus Eisenbacteria bacterium]MCC7143939.1 3-hydroxybutyryl-CoA dehydrogenase [Candidatus Eisenbacteria bacterium]
MERNRRIGVVGGGTMGNGIAQVFAQIGYPVVLVDSSPEALDRAAAQIQKSLERLVKKGTLAEQDVPEILERISRNTKPEALREAQLVVEAIFEDAQVKRELFARLDEVTGPDCILASNTSSISITEIAGATKRADRVIGMHFMNPVPVMTLVEIIRGLATSNETYKAVEGLTKELGKTPVEVQDYPGFVSNRVLMPMINEAVYCLMEGVATKESIDTVMKLGMNHPMGPLTLADFIGLDVCLHIMEVLHSGLGDDKYRPCPLLRKMVAAGRLGRKVGRGFYEYE